jgi:hypothetical protein
LNSLSGGWGEQQIDMITVQQLAEALLPIRIQGKVGEKEVQKAAKKPRCDDAAAIGKSQNHSEKRVL